MDTPIITAKSMEDIIFETFGYCLPEDDEENCETLSIQGIDTEVTLNSTRLEEKRKTMLAWLKLLPDVFRSGEFGGQFLQLGDTNTPGIYWTFYHGVMEMLLIMAIGLNLMEYTFPRNEWKDLPHQMPYVKIIQNNLDGKE